MEIRSFGKIKDGRGAGLYILRNSHGMSAAVTDYGATLVSVMVPDINGRSRDVVLGHDSAAEYETGGGSLGATVGRVANRIGNATFELNGVTYKLLANNGPNCLHGGKERYNKRLWDVKVPFSSVNSRDIAGTYAVESISDGGSARARAGLRENQVTFHMDSPDGDQGFPGNFHLDVTYSLTDDNELHIDYFAVSDADTPINLTNHSYFNMDGQGSGHVLRQQVQISADRFTPVDEFGLPTGEIWNVTGTPMDLRIPKQIGQGITEGLNSGYEQIVLAKGYDHNYVLNGDGYREVASMYSDNSGIKMLVLTDLPGMQFYTANGLNGEPGKDGIMYEPMSGACFETQFFPDAVNRENFPGGVLKAGEEFRTRTTYKFVIG